MIACREFYGRGEDGLLRRLELFRLRRRAGWLCGKGDVWAGRLGCCAATDIIVKSLPIF
jgi:hypothetical protein